MPFYPQTIKDKCIIWSFVLQVASLSGNVFMVSTAIQWLNNATKVWLSPLEQNDRKMSNYENELFPVSVPHTDDTFKLDSYTSFMIIFEFENLTCAEKIYKRLAVISIGKCQLNHKNTSGSYICQPVSRGRAFPHLNIAMYANDKAIALIKSSF